MNSIISYVLGHVRLEVRGERISPFLNSALAKGLQLWDIRILDEHRAEMHVTLRDFFKLRPILKTTGCRMRTRQRFGLPFLWDRLFQRKVLLGGILFFIAGIYVLSSFIWSVQVEGNEKVATSTILDAARQKGLYLHQWKFRLQDPDTMSRELHSLLPGTAWVGVQVEGTKLIIKVVESTEPDKKPVLGPRNIVASKNALITEISATKGRVMVKPNTYVRKGDVLISGIIGDEQNNKTVAAEGKVKGIVWYVPKVEVPLTMTYKVYTGESFKKNYLVIGQRGLQITGYRSPNYDSAEVIPNRKSLSWRNFVLPFGWLSEKVMEVNYVEQKLELADARAIGLNQARAEMTSNAGQGARVTGEKILHEKTENGKVYMEVHFEVEESITAEQPINH